MTDPIYTAGRQPDFENMLRVLRRERPARPTLYEMSLHDALVADLAGMPVQAGESRLARLQRQVTAFANAGYDYVIFGDWDFGFPIGEVHQQASLSLNEGFVITDRDSFHAYPWTDPDDYDYSPLRDIAAELPAGMKVISTGPYGVLENVIRLLGYENLCLLLLDDPALVGEVFDAVGSRMLAHYRLTASMPAVGACISSDDWGFKTQPMLSPADMRQYVVPWHARIVEAIHAAGKPAILHSCGQLSALMDDIIDTIGYDGKHSNEDTIQPVEAAYDQYHARIAVLGGIDVDFLCRATPEAITARSRAMLAHAPTGYALGTGNSVPPYVPTASYLAMLDAAVRE